MSFDHQKETRSPSFVGNVTMSTIEYGMKQLANMYTFTVSKFRTLDRRETTEIS